VVPTPELSHQALRYPSAELARHYRANGWWTDDTLSEMAFSGVEKASATKLRIRSRVHPYVGTIGAVGDMGRRLAGRLRRWGIEEGDVVAFQIPNWAEAVACVYGLLSLGVVVVPIAHIYGTKEVGHILRESRARALVTAEAQYFALQGVEQAMEVVELARDSLNPKLSLLGVLLNLADMRTVHSREALASLKERFGEQVFDTVVRASIAYAESAERAKSILDHRPDLGADYLALAGEVLERLSGLDGARKRLTQLA